MFSRLQRRRSNLQDMGRLSKSCPAVDNPASDDSSASESSYNESSGSSASLSDPFAESSEEVKAPISRAEKQLTRMSLRRAKQREVEQKRNLEQNRISMDDYLGKQAQFRIWLLEEQKKQAKDLSSPKRKTYFKMFVRLWNKRHLPAKFYESRLSWHMEGESPAPEDKRSPLYSDRPRFSLLQNSPALDPSIFPHTIDLSSDSIIPGSPDPSPFSTFGKGSPAVNLTPFRFTAQSGKASASQTLESAGPSDRQKGKTPMFRTRNNVFKFGANKENTAHHSLPLKTENEEYLRTATISPRKKMISVCQARSLDRKVVNWSPRGHLKLNAVDSPRCPSPFSSHPSLISDDGNMITTTANSSTTHLDLAVPTCSEVYQEVKDVIESSSPTYADIPFAEDEKFCDNQTKAVTSKEKFNRRRSRSVDEIPVYAVPKKQDRERAWSEKQVVSEEFSVSPPPVPPKRFDPHAEGLGIAFSAPNSAQKDVPVTDQHQAHEGKKEETDHGKEASKKSANLFKGRLPWFGKKITSRRRSRSCEALSPSVQSATMTSSQANGDPFPLVRMDRSPTLNRRTLTRPLKLPGHQPKVTDNKDKGRPKPSFCSPAPRLADISDKIKARDFTVPTTAEDKCEGIKPFHKLKFELAEYSSSPMRLGSRPRLITEKDTVSSLKKGPSLRRRSRSMEQIASPGIGQSDHYEQMVHSEKTQHKVHSKNSWLDHSNISKLNTHSSKIDQFNKGHDLLASTDQTNQFMEESNIARETQNCSSNNVPTNHCNSVPSEPIVCLEARSSEFPPPPPPLTMPMSTDTCLDEPYDRLPPPASPLHCELYEEIKSSVHSKLSSLVHKLSDADLSLDLSQSLALEQLPSSPKRLRQNQDESDANNVNTMDMINPVHKESGCQEENSSFHVESVADTVEKAHGTQINASVNQDLVMMDCTENCEPTAAPTNSHQNSEDQYADHVEASLQYDSAEPKCITISQSIDNCKALVVDMKTCVNEPVSIVMERPVDRQNEVHAPWQVNGGKDSRLKELTQDLHQSSETMCQREVVRNPTPHQELAFSVSVSVTSQNQVCKLLAPARKTQVLRRRSRSVGDRSSFTQVMVNNTKTHLAPICKDMLSTNQAPANVVSSLTFTPAVPLYKDVKGDIPASRSVNTTHMQACQNSKDRMQCSNKISNAYLPLSLSPTKSEKKQALKQEKTSLGQKPSSLNILSKETPQALQKKHLHESTNEQAPQDEQKPQALVQTTDRQTLKDKETEPELLEKNHQDTQNMVNTQCGEQTAFTKHLDQSGVSLCTEQTSTQPECAQPFKTPTLASSQHKFGTSLRSTPSRHRRRSRSVGDLTGVEEDSGVQTGEGRGFASVRSFWDGLRGKVEGKSPSVTLQRKPSTMRRLQQQLYGTSTPVTKEKSCDVIPNNQPLVPTVATVPTENVEEAGCSRLVDDKPKVIKLSHTDCDASRDIAQPPSQCKAEKIYPIDTAACIQLEKIALTKLGNEPLTLEKSLGGTQREGEPCVDVQVQNETCEPSLTSSKDEESVAMKTSPFVTVRRQSSRKQCVVPSSAQGHEQVQTETNSGQKGHQNVKHTQITGSEQGTPINVHHRKPVSEKILSSVEKDSKSCAKVDLKLSATAVMPTHSKVDNVLSGSETTPTVHVPSGGKRKPLLPPKTLPKPTRRPLTMTASPQQSSAKQATSSTSTAVLGAPRKRRSQELDRGSQPGKRCVTGEKQDKRPVTRSTVHQGIGFQEQLSVPTTTSLGVVSINNTKQNTSTPMTVTAVVLEGMSQTMTSTPVGARPIRSVKRRSTEKQDIKDVRPVKRRSSGKAGQLTDTTGKCDKKKDVSSSGGRKPNGWKENGMHSPVVIQSPVVRRTSSRLESQGRSPLVSDCRKKTDNVSVRRQSSGRESSPRNSLGRRQSGVRATLSRSGSVRAQVSNLNTQLAHTSTPVNRTNSGRGTPLVLSAQKKASTISGTPCKTTHSNKLSATNTPSTQGSASAQRRSSGRGKPYQTSFGSQRTQTREVHISNTASLSDRTTKQSGHIPDQLKSVSKLSKDREPTHSSPLPSVVKRLSTINRRSGCSPVKRRSGGGSGFTPASKRSSIGNVKSRRNSGKVKRTDSSRSSRGPDSDIDETSSTSSRNTSFRKHGKTPQSPTFLRITQRLGVYEEQDSDDSMDITPADEQLAHKIIAGLQKVQTMKVDTASHHQPSFSNDNHFALSSSIQTKAVKLASLDKKPMLSFGDEGVGDVYRDDSNMETDIDARQGDDQPLVITGTKTSKLSTLV